MTHRLVIIESPFGSMPDGTRAPKDVVAAHKRYLAAALRDSLLRGEAPFASHGLYTLPGVFDDANKEERELGITAGFAWRHVAWGTMVYADLGITSGMRRGIEHAKELGRVVEYRNLPEWKGQGK